MPEGVPIGSRPRRDRLVLIMKQERDLTEGSTQLGSFATTQRNNPPIWSFDMLPRYRAVGTCGREATNERNSRS
jgi:hypothetical protein